MLWGGLYRFRQRGQEGPLCRSDSAQSLKAGTREDTDSHPRGQEPPTPTLCYSLWSVSHSELNRDFLGKRKR